MPDLLVGFDSGASLGKALYQIQAGDIQLLLMEPEVLGLPYESIKAYQEGEGKWGLASSENDAWVQFNKKDKHCYVVGYLAKYFDAIPRMNLLKYENSLYKIMAAIGVIQARLKLPLKFSVGITATLPVSEYVNREQLEIQLKQSLKSYYFRDQNLRVELEMFDCLPEGGGVALSLMNAHGLNWLLQRTLVVLMLGHRDTSCLVFERGVMKPGSAEKLGFFRLVDKVIRRTAGQSQSSLTKAIYEIGEDINPDNEILRTLIRSEQAVNVEIEAKQLAGAIRVARQETWAALQNWIDSSIPNELTTLAVAGGTSRYLEREISQHLGWTKPCWLTELVVEIKQVLKLMLFVTNPSEADALAYRLLDLYCSFTDLLEKQQSSNVA